MTLLHVIGCEAIGEAAGVVGSASTYPELAQGLYTEDDGDEGTLAVESKGPASAYFGVGGFVVVKG